MKCVIYFVFLRGIGLMVEKIIFMYICCFICKILDLFVVLIFIVVFCLINLCILIFEFCYVLI